MISKIKIFELSDIQKDIWDKFLLNNSKQATVFHTQEWMKVLQEAHGYEPKYISVTNDNSVAIMPFMIDTRFGIKNYLSMPYDTYGGMIGDYNLNNDIIDSFIHLPGIGVRYIIDYYHILYNGYLVSTELMDISPEIGDIWHGLHKANRTAIKSALKHNVVTQIITKNITIFDKVPQILVNSIIKYMVPSGYCIIYTAMIEDQIVAASIFFIYNDMAIYWANTTTDLGRKTNANYLLLWDAIQYAKKRGCKIFNFGASPDKADSLVKFKTSWSTTRHFYVKYQKVPILLYPAFKLREVLYG